MIAPDFLTPWFAVFLIVGLWSRLAVCVLRAPADPEPELSRLDRLDGLDSRTG